MSLSALGIHCWGSQDLWLQAGGTQRLLQSCRSWEPSHTAPSLPAIIPGHQTLSSAASTAKGLGGSLPPRASLGPPSTAYLECACQHRFSKTLNLPLTTFALFCSCLLDCAVTYAEANTQNCFSRYAQAFRFFFLIKNTPKTSAVWVREADRRTGLPKISLCQEGN